MNRKDIFTICHALRKCRNYAEVEAPIGISPADMFNVFREIILDEIEKENANFNRDKALEFIGK